MKKDSTYNFKIKPVVRSLSALDSTYKNTIIARPVEARTKYCLELIGKTKVNISKTPDRARKKEMKELIAAVEKELRLLTK